MVVFEELRELFSARSRWRNLRAAVHSSNPPCIPFVGIYLSDLSSVPGVVWVWARVALRGGMQGGGDTLCYGGNALSYVVMGFPAPQPS